MTATVTQLRPSAPVDDRPAAAVCECPHGAHRPVKMFGPKSTFRVASFQGHATGSRLRAGDVAVADGPAAPRLCPPCRSAGHGAAS